MPKEIFKCEYCGKDVLKYKSQINGNVYCDIKCKGLFWSENNRGENNPNYGKRLYGESNPNYGKRWSEEQRQKASETTKKRYEDPEYRYNIGKSNRGKKLPQELIDRMHDRPLESYSHPHTDESKKIIGQKSKEKWTKEYKIKNRKTREQLGMWVPLKDKPDMEIYFRESAWKERMWDRIDDDEQLKLLHEKGIFNPIKNSKGVVRDHKFSRKMGFSEKVFPEILAHPMNCEILLHADNVRKSHKECSSIRLATLFSYIENYKGEWFENTLVLKLIEDYKNGKRWERRL